MADSLLERLAQVVGSANVDGPSQIEDWREFFVGEAQAVVRPADTAEVGECVKVCVELGLSIVPQGGNTGMSGGTVPFEGQNVVMINLARMNAIEEINPNQFSMTVQAGVIVEAIQDAAAEVDRLFAPDWGARGTALIGGGIATDAGGLNVVRWGNMRDHILGLEVVLPDGRIWNGLRALRKDSSGYDLKQLFIGSEGTLGIVTRATLKLQHATPYGLTALAAISDINQLPELFQRIGREANGTLTAFELVPEIGLERAMSKIEMARPMETRADYYALLRLTSAAPVTDLMGEVLGSAADAGLITDAAVASTADQDANLWKMREELPPVRIWPMHAHGVKMDTAVPIDLVLKYLDGVKAIAAEVAPGSMAYAFGHVGDGNMHTYVMPADDADAGAIEAFRALKPELQSRLDQLAFSLGGTLSAEHGVGRETLGRVDGQKPPIEVELMNVVKAAFDPNGIMNPGKMLASRD